MGRQNEEIKRPESTDGRIVLDPLCSRRQTLKWGGMSIIGLSVLGPVLAQGATAPLIIMEQAEGLVVADTAKCVGCGRCELACTEFNDGKAAPSLSRIKVDRNLNFGPAGLLAWREGQGNWGNGLVVQDLCKQCPHPVPCANICPEDAIVVAPVGKARMVDLGKVHGLRGLPEGMPLGDDLLRPGYAKGNQVPSLRRQAEMRRGLPCRVAEFCELARPDRGSASAYCDGGCASDREGALLPGVPPARSEGEPPGRLPDDAGYFEGWKAPFCTGVRIAVD